jgi:PadR family transcriptional regulator PadR
MKVDKSLLSGSTTLLVLSLLRGGDLYGYEMISELSRRSDKTFELKEGTLYPILHGLERDKCVTVYEKQAPTGRMRKYYHITQKGLEELEQKQEEWRVFADKVNGVVFGEAPALA